MFSSCTNHRLPRVGGTKRAAFVLVMVLALLLVCALCLTGLARRSLESGEQVATAQTDLQRRWGVLSCVRTYLPLAQDLLEGESAKLPAEARTWPMPSSVAAEFDLGELHFSVLLADEDAKVNLNAVCRDDSDGPRTAASIVEQSAAGVDGLAVNVQPLPTESVVNRASVAFRSWGQVFESTDSAGPGEFAARLRDATRAITCWGSGRLNIQRASDEAIRLVCSNKVAPDIVGKLIARRREPGVTGLAGVISQLGLRAADRGTLERLLTDHSSRYSLWILVQSPRRNWATLTVGSGSSAQAAHETFTW